MANRFGVDVGGTFTDLIYLDHDTQTIVVGKGPSTPASPDIGVVDVVTATMTVAQISGAEYFLHGTTVGINALLERRGAKVALLATDGFRDVLEIRRGDRGAAMYELLWKAPPPLVPRPLRFDISERIGADGSVVAELDPTAVSRVVEVLQGEGVEAVAVCFINAHANAAHELRAESLLREAGFDGTISLSHRITGELREYERTSTTVIDAYVRPRVSAYLGLLDERLREGGFAGGSLVTRSGGGAFSFDEARERPFETVMSGPVAGSVGAGILCRTLGRRLAITADVGGTSFDTCLIVDGHPRVRFEGDIEGMPLQAPWVDVRSIGAGGGSIARIEGGLLRVGPQSSGAVPGPVCYRRGGTLPTVTDAAAALGMLGHGELAGGFTLDLAGAAAVIDQLAREMDADTDQAAAGVLAVANANMADEVRTILSEVGESSAEAAVIAFGGAGPLFGCLLADELSSDTVIVPNYAGNFSAWSLLLQDVARSTARTLIVELDTDGVQAAEELALVLDKQLGERSEATGDTIKELSLDLRYAGQEYSLPIPVNDNGLVVASTLEILRSRFEDAYERSYGVRLDTPVQISAVRLTERRPLPDVPVADLTNETSAAPVSTIEAYSFTTRRREPFRVVHRSHLVQDGFDLDGPMVITEETTTTYVDVGWRVDVEPNGTLILTKETS
jgi:N-methylhydantoinase A